jgi:hypothetical protein
MKIIIQLNAALQKGLAKEVFDHVRNYFICALLLAIGTNELNYPDSLLFGLVPGNYSGMGIIGVSFILIALNLYDGIRKLSNLKYHFVFSIVLITIYVFLSVRVIEMAWDYRDATGVTNIGTSGYPDPGSRLVSFA